MLRTTTRAATPLRRLAATASDNGGTNNSLRSLRAPSFQAMSSAPRAQAACELGVVCRWSSGLMALKGAPGMKQRTRTQHRLAADAGEWGASHPLVEQAKYQWRRVSWRLTSQAAALPMKLDLRCPKKQHRKRAAVSPGIGLFPRSGTSSAGSGGQELLLTSAAAGWAGIVAVGMSGGVMLDADMLARMLGNAPMVFAVIGFSDTLAQFLSGARPAALLTDKQRAAAAPPPPINLQQSAEVGLVGVGLTGFGTMVWLDCLHVLIPAADCGFYSGAAITALAVKALLDSAVWGTLANSISIITRKMVGGEGLPQAASFWRASIFQVTRSDFAFWPAWAAMTFTVSPSP